MNPLLSAPPILLAEDDENDRFFLHRALQRAGLPNRLITVQDGQEAINYLAGNGAFADRHAHPLPGLLLLDLNMPKLNGFEVLAWLDSQPDFEQLPVVVLSSSAQESDIQKARDLGADDYQIKPQNYETLITIIRELHSRWLA
jgi:CheY-like chemotaxis protein